MMRTGVKMNYTNSLRYDIHGRKRKTNALRKAKPYQPKASVVESRQDAYTVGHEQDMQRMQEHREMYPSMSDMGIAYVPAEDTSYKKEESKNYTVAIGYNKGTYQVIPRDEITSIGK
jgi:hypothetical protein